MATRKRPAKVAAIKQRTDKFMEAHRKGMAALRRHDFKTLETAIEDERQVILEQRKTIAAAARKAKKKRAT